MDYISFSCLSKVFVWYFRRGDRNGGGGGRGRRSGGLGREHEETKMRQSVARDRKSNWADEKSRKVFGGKRNAK